MRPHADAVSRQADALSREWYGMTTPYEVKWNLDGNESCRISHQPPTRGCNERSPCASQAAPTLSGGLASNILCFLFPPPTGLVFYSRTRASPTSVMARREVGASILEEVENDRTRATPRIRRDRAFHHPRGDFTRLSSKSSADRRDRGSAPRAVQYVQYSSTSMHPDNHVAAACGCC